MKLLHTTAYISKKQLLDRLEKDYSLASSSRTLERDFQFLATELGISVLYCHAEKGYFIERESSSQVLLFLKFSSSILFGQFLQNSLRDFGDLPALIKPESYYNYEGSLLIEPILLALRNKQIIRFTHFNFKRNSSSRYTITPFQLREYDRRWYVVGLPEGESHIKTFGLSRITDPEVVGSARYDISEFEDQLEKFDSIVGLNYDESEKKEIIRIAVTNHQYKYLRSLPLHFSQHFEKFLPDGRVLLTLTLIPNYELKMQFLKMGDQVEVLEPEFLRDEMKTIITNSSRLYEKDS